MFNNYVNMRIEINFSYVFYLKYDLSSVLRYFMFTVS